MKGNSQQRQLEAARTYAREHGLELDETLTFQDLGVSAFKGANAAMGALNTFRRAVEDGIIEAGSYLLVEDFDRLSRQDPWSALPVFQLIIDAGITIVTLKDGQTWSRKALREDQFLLMKSVLAMWNGHQESVKKSERVAAAYAAKRARLIAGDAMAKPYKRIGPAWTRYDDDAKAFVLVIERAAVVQQIFERADMGLGIDTIARELNTASVPTWGDGKRKARFWRGSYIRRILTNRAVIGEFTPHTTGSDEETGKRRDTPLEPIHNLYPVAVDRELFERVSSRISTTAPRGRNAGGTPTSVVAGVAKCARCGSSMLRVSKGKPPKAKYAYLVCSKAHAKAAGCEYLPVRYESVEEALRANAAVIVRDAPRGDDTGELEERIDEQAVHVSVLEDRQQTFVEELVRSKDETLREEMRANGKKLAQAVAELRRMRALRDATASAYVVKRLEALGDALERNPFDVAAANRTLRQAAQAVVVDPTGNLTIHWHHSDTPTEDIPFWTRRGGFDAV